MSQIVSRHSGSGRNMPPRQPTAMERVGGEEAIYRGTKGDGDERGGTLADETRRGHGTNEADRETCEDLSGYVPCYARHEPWKLGGVMMPPRGSVSMLWVRDDEADIPPSVEPVSEPEAGSVAR
jgi:hypothetical protein